MDTTSHPDELGAIAEAIKDIDICMLVTDTGSGLRGRPMSNNGNVDYDGDSWFFAMRDSDKVRQIEAQATVELAYMGTERGSGISIEGPADPASGDAASGDAWGARADAPTGTRRSAAMAPRIRNLLAGMGD